MPGFMPLPYRTNAPCETRRRASGSPAQPRLVTAEGVDGRAPGLQGPIPPGHLRLGLRPGLGHAGCASGLGCTGRARGAPRYAAGLPLLLLLGAVFASVTFGAGNGILGLGQVQVFQGGLGQVGGIGGVSHGLVERASCWYTEWVKARRSGDQGQCVEMRRDGEAVQVRDSKNVEGGRLPDAASRSNLLPVAQNSHSSWQICHGTETPRAEASPAGPIGREPEHGRT
ncbi:MAG: hypothetical protein QG608_2556 [Actinomycetota bacterium]|nr:hypothetical protein [Actinomycetota bacterium]MDQ1294671.1 hypothetical protein [Actinomycetota bacterium]